MATNQERWKSQPEAHDYGAATDYLSLILPAGVVEATVDSLRAAGLIHRKAKDLLRASTLPLLARDDPEVAKDIAKVHRGEKLSPILVVRGELSSDRPLTIADGYHRVCASYHLDENAEMPCHLADIVLNP